MFVTPVFLSIGSALCQRSRQFTPVNRCRTCTQGFHQFDEDRAGLYPHLQPLHVVWRTNGPLTVGEVTDSIIRICSQPDTCTFAHIFCQVFSKLTIKDCISVCMIIEKVRQPENIECLVDTRNAAIVYNRHLNSTQAQAFHHLLSWT